MKKLLMTITLSGSAIAGLLIGPLKAAEMAAAGPMEGTMICRPAGAGDHANAQMMGQSRQLICKPVAMAMKMSDGNMRVIGTVTAHKGLGPDLSHALTPQQVNDAWITYIEREFHIDHSS